MGFGSAYYEMIEREREGALNMTIEELEELEEKLIKKQTDSRKFFFALYFD